MPGTTPSSLPQTATETELNVSPSGTGHATESLLDPEAQANLDAVCDAVKNQVISWGPKAKWKIDLLLLPDGPETVADALCSASSSTKDDTENLTTVSSLLPTSSSVKGVDVAVQTSEVPEPRLPVFDDESLKHLDVYETRKQLAKATERIRRLESLIMSQRREMTEKVDAANARADQAAADTNVLTRHLQRQERDLEARHDVERQLREAEVRVLSRKLRALTGAQRFAAMPDDEGSEDDRRTRDIETRLAQTERIYGREQRALRKKLRQSENRSAQREMELDQALEQVTAYMNYAQQLHAHAAQQHHLAQHQQQQNLHSDAPGPANAQPDNPANSNWASFGDRKRVRSGLDDLLAAAAEAENAEGTRQGLPNSSPKSQVDGDKATNTPPTTSSTKDAKRISPAVAAANAHVAKAAETAAATAAKRDNKDKGNHNLQQGEHSETNPPSDILPRPFAERNGRPARVHIPPPILPPPPSFSGPILPFGPPSSHTPPMTPTTPQKKTRSPYIKWTIGEDSLLRAAVKSHGSNWDLIARAVPGRTYHQCRQRWVNVLKNGGDDDEEEDTSTRTTPSPSPESMTGMPTPSNTGGNSPKRPPGVFPVNRPQTQTRATPAPPQSNRKTALSSTI